MKSKHIPAFRKWLAVMIHMDARLNGSDFNNLYRVFKNSLSTRNH